MAWQTDLAGIKPVSEWTQEDFLRFNRDFGWVLRGGDDGGRQFFSDGSEGGNLPALNDDGQFQFPVNNRTIIESQLNPRGYSTRYDELATQAQALGLTPEQALQYIYGPGSQIIDAGPYGQLIQAGFSDPSQWRLPTMSGFGNGFLDNFADGGGLVALMAAGIAGLGAAGATVGEGAAAGGTAAGDGFMGAINAGGLDGALGDAGSFWGNMFGAGEAGAAGATGGALSEAQQWAQSLGGLNADGSINWAAIDASPTLQSMGAISGDFGAIPFGTSASGSGTFLDQLRTLANGGNLPGGSSISSLLGGSSSSSDFLRTLGTLGATGLGVYGANQQQNAYSDLADKYLAMGAPFRERLLASYSPDFSVSSIPGAQDAIDTTMNSTLRGLSTSGNPFDNPGALMEANKYVTSNVALPAINTYRSQLGTFGQLGTNTAGAADTAAAGSAGGVANALGYGLNQITNPQTSLADMLKKYSINNGSTF